MSYFSFEIILIPVKNIACFTILFLVGLQYIVGTLIYS